MNTVTVICPLPLVVRVLKRARELAGCEQRYPYPQWRPDRHGMQFVFADAIQGNLFFSEASGMIHQWEDEHDPDIEIEMDVIGDSSSGIAPCSYDEL